MRRKRLYLWAALSGFLFEALWKWANKEPHWVKASRCWDSTALGYTPDSYMRG